MLDPDFETNLKNLQKKSAEYLHARAKAGYYKDKVAFDSASQQLVKYELASRAELKAEALRYAADRKLDPAANDDTKAAQLLLAFARGCRLTRLWRDLMGEVRIGARHAKKIHQIVLPALDALGRRGDLAKLLDDPDPSVRASAASLMMNDMPERCVPVLEGVYRTERMLDAGWVAHRALPHDSVERIHAEHAKIAAQRRQMLPTDSTN